MSEMYKEEVPLYGDLLDIVKEVNKMALESDIDATIRHLRFGKVNRSRLEVERHGAIRLGTAEEFRIIHKLFAVLGLFPIGYYDLSEAGLPMHATCFRPITPKALERNPFRVFTSVLRLELIRDAGVRDLAQELLGRRNIFSKKLLDLLDLSAHQAGRLDASEGKAFVAETLKVFRWQGKSMATEEQYNGLRAEHAILADICCFGTSHINHLTPRTLDITTAQKMMEATGMRCKDRIEGPPPRMCPILLRQTSFLAIEETITFPKSSVSLSRNCADGVAGSSIGCHRARFGEIEERGAAVTPHGRALYDELTRKTMNLVQASREAATHNRSQEEVQDEYNKVLEDVFSEFPDDWDTLQRRKLVYFSYRIKKDKILESGPELRADSPHEKGSRKLANLSELLADGIVEAMPITYEDFLPLSAAGIFQSNIELSAVQLRIKTCPDVEGMERAMQAHISDPDALYRHVEEMSLQECGAQLGMTIVS
ncbi:hypothetical protein MBLNU13_g10329t3 [Cladosporium sp. NU13]